MANQAIQHIDDKEFEKLMRFYLISQMMQNNSASSRMNAFPMNYSQGIPSMYSMPQQKDGFNGVNGNRIPGLNDRETSIEALLSRNYQTRSATDKKAGSESAKPKQYATSTSTGNNPAKGHTPGYLMLNPTFVVQYTFHLTGDARPTTKIDAKSSGTDNTKTASTGGMEAILTNAGKTQDQSRLYSGDNSVQNLQYLLQNASLIPNASGEHNARTATTSSTADNYQRPGINYNNGMSGTGYSGNATSATVLSKAGTRNAAGPPGYAVSTSGQAPVAASR